MASLSYQTLEPKSSFYSPSHPSTSHIFSAAPSQSSASFSFQRRYQSHPSFLSRLDQIQQLGGRAVYSDRQAGRAGSISSHVGHAGCVNALCWSESGDLLASGSDDTRVILWKLGTSHIHPTADRPGSQDPMSFGLRRAMGEDRYLRSLMSVRMNRNEEDQDPSSNSADLQYPPLEMGMSSVIQTGHTANIFSVAFAPNSCDSKLFTAAGDATMRVFDIGSSSAASGSRVSQPDGRWYNQFEHGSRDVQCRVLKCHRRRVKRLATENSPDIFLSVAEDGDVRSTDLRTSHTCRTNCPRPLLHSFTSLYSLSLSKLQPYLFAVAGNSPYTYLYDRRMIGRVIQDEWGMTTSQSDEALLSKCVRRFGIPKGDWHGDCSILHESKGKVSMSCSRYQHITAVKISEHNGNDLIATYSNGAIYRFGIRDEEGALHHVQHRLPEGWDMKATATTNERKRSHRQEGNRGQASVASSCSSKTSASASFANEVSARHTKAVRSEASGARNFDSAQNRPLKTALSRVSMNEAAGQSSDAGQEVEAVWERAFVGEGHNGADDEERGSLSTLDSPTEQEAQGFPLYQQLLADGEAGSLDLSSSSGSSDEADQSEGDWEDVDSPRNPVRPAPYLPRWFNDAESSEEDESEEEVVEEDLVEGSLETATSHSNDTTDDEDAEDDSISDSTEDDRSFSPDPDPDVEDPHYAHNVRQASDDYVPVVYPRWPRYTGHLNSETVKEVNFLGPHDEFIVSGSDDGNFFVWDVASGEILGIWQGDGSIVNVIVPHPTLPVLAVSGIDDSIKLFGPVSASHAGQCAGAGADGGEEEGKRDRRRKTRMSNLEAIVRRNTARSVRGADTGGQFDDDDDGEEEDEVGNESGGQEEDTLPPRDIIQAVLARAALARREEGEEDLPSERQCDPM